MSRHRDYAIRSRRSYVFRASAVVLTLATTLGAVWSVQASPAAEELCRQQGAYAERLAVARDQAMTMQQAIAAVAERDSTVNVALLKEAADLLFHRFRSMPVDQVALEFMAACLDDAH